MQISIIHYNIIIFIFCYYSHLLQYEKKVYEADVNINTTTAIIFAILAVVMVYIAFPSLNFTFDSSNRFNALLPGHFWNHFSIILLLFAVGNLKNSRIINKGKGLSVTGISCGSVGIVVNIIYTIVYIIIFIFATTAVDEIKKYDTEINNYYNETKSYYRNHNYEYNSTILDDYDI